MYILLSLLLFLARIVVVIAMSPSRVVNVIHLFGRIVFVTPLFRGSSTCYAFRVCGVHGGGVGFLFPIGLKGDLTGWPWRDSKGASNFKDVLMGRECDYIVHFHRRCSYSLPSLVFVGRSSRLLCS